MAPFARRERKHRKRARLEEASKAEDAGNEREKRKEQLKQDLRAPDTKLNSKKRKRLDKYVESKLKKEQNANIIAKLAQQGAVDTSLLQSSKRLGRVGESKRERLQRALRERDAGITDGHEILYETRQLATPSDNDGDESEEDFEEEPAAAASTTAGLRQSGGVTFGTGLKQPLEVDEQGKPLIRKRKRRKKAHKSAPPALQAIDPEPASEDAEEYPTEDLDYVSGGEDEDIEWHGFSSTDEGPAGNDSVASESEDDASEEEEESDADTKPRISAFKQWADAQRNAASNFTPSAIPTADATVMANFKPREPSPDPMLASTTVATSNRPVGSITIERSDSVHAARLELPVVQEEQKIMEAIHNNPIVVVCGATGSGKTTQIPQMLYENGYGSAIGSGRPSTTESLQTRGMIGVTQPRRVAATSVADRVALELGPSHRNRVAHQVRYDSNVGRDTAIKFMTDGILLREIQQDFALSKYSCVVVDEAHERSVNTDILIGLLSRIVPLRHSLAKEDPAKHCPLKLIVMSATLRVTDFLKNTRLFKDGPPPIVEAEGRQYPVTVHFARRTKQDLLDETVEKVAKGHRKLPAGGMLVFLTGQQEIQTVAARLKERFGGPQTNGAKEPRWTPEAATSLKGNHNFVEDEVEGHSDDDSDIDIETEDTEFAIPSENTEGGAVSGQKAPLKAHILPLYAALPASQQSKVFAAPPEGHRQIILATNVAETSLTIPGVRFVFDCGRSKEKVYSTTSGIQSFETQWISKASASQRTGRAGRTGPGHCWRLYSSAVYEQFFAEHADPEILRTPLESVVLQLKGFDVENVANFPFPTTPDGTQLVAAEKLLVNLGAIEDGRISRVGQELARLPVSPRFGKMLLKARENGVLEYVVSLVAALAVGELLIPEPQTFAVLAADDDDNYELSVQQRRDEEDSRMRHQAYTRAQAKLASLDDRSDAIKLLTAIVMHAEDGSKKNDKGEAFSKQYFLRQKGMEEAQQLRHQLWNILVSALPPQAAPLGEFKVMLPPPTNSKLGLIRQAAAAGFVDQVAIRADLLPSGGVSFGRKPRRAAEVAYRPLMPLSSAEGDVDEKTLEPSEREMLRSVFIHPSSVLARLSVSEMPQYIAYTHLSRANTANAKIPRTRMHPLTAIGPRTIAYLAEKTPLIQYGKPLTGGMGKLGIVESEGGKKRECWVPVSGRSPDAAGGVEWPLDRWKVLQRRGKRAEWAVERVLAYGAAS